MPDLPITWPRRGLDENEAHSSQAPDTYRDGRNVRTKDPVSGSLRGGQRSGHTKYCPTQLAAGKVRRGLVVAHDVPNITFGNKASALAAADIVDSADTPSMGDSPRIVTDRVGDIYAIDGKAGIVKFNPRFKEQWRINLPTEDETHEVRALWVDDFSNVYAAVSLGEQPTLGRIWKYRPNLETDISLDWTYEPGGLVPDLVERNGVLYYVVNFPDTGKTNLVALTNLGRNEPLKVFEQIQLPHPANAIAVNMDGALLTAHEPNNDRGKNPQAPDSDTVQESWSPRNLTNYESRIWSWHSADNLDGLGNSSFSEDDDVPVIIDQSGNGRHYYAAIDESLPEIKGGTPVAVTAGTFAEKAQAGRPGLRFNGTSNLYKSRPNVSTGYGSRDGQQTTVPAYQAARDELGVVTPNTGSAYLVVMAVRVDLDEDSARARFLWSHEGADDDAGTPEDRHILVNKNSSALTTNVAVGADTGRIFVHEQTDHTTVGSSGGNSPAGGFLPASGNFSGDFGLDDGAGTPVFGDAIDNTSNIAIISYLCDGGFEAGNYADDVTHSFVRYNGRPIDRYCSNPNYTLEPDYLGGTGVADADLPAVPTLGELNRYFKGWFLEKIVIARTVDLAAATTEDIVVEHTKYGNSTVPVTGDADWPGQFVDQDDTELAKLEGYLMHRWGKKSVAPGTSTEYGHPYRSDVPLAPTQPATFNVNTLRDASGILAKWSGDSGLPIWSVQGANLGLGGIGYDVKVSPLGYIYSYGPANGAAVFARRIDDTGDLPTITGGDTWLASLGMTQTNLTFDETLPRMAVDEKDNVYVPVGVTPASGSAPSGDVVVLDKDGTVLHNFNRTGVDQWFAISCAVPPGPLPPYPDTLTGQRSPYFWAAGKGEDEGANDIDNIVRVSTITETVNANPSRVITQVAAVGDTLYKVTDVTRTTPTGGSGILDATSRYLDMFAAYEKGCILDGKNYYLYDPKTDEVTEWVADQGELPPRCRIGVLWRGRPVLSAGDDPHEVYFGAQGGLLDWNRNPPVPLATQAFRLSDTRMGAVPDIVRALIPASEETLIIACDHSIHSITGEPLLEGRPQVISDQIGIAWNSSWTKDREGRIYFFESQGGVWVMSLGGGAQRITRDKIERRLRAIDLSTYYVHLEWDHEDEGLRVALFPWGAPGALVERYFWEQQVDAWHPDTSSDLDKQPTAMWALDGDEPGDRILMVGTGDGYVLKQDRLAPDDDGTAIQASVDIGAFGALSTGRETRFNRWAITLADDQDGARAQMLKSNEPDVKGAPVMDVELVPGRNGPIYNRATAAHLWLRLSNNRQGERFAFEHSSVMASLAGRIKPKARENTVGL